MLRLGVNIDHVATLRQARYRGLEDDWRAEPDPVEAARICLQAGAQGITAHLREDRRHIVDRDLERLRLHVPGRLNLEMANTPEMLAIALRVRPDIICMVPERREEVTTEGGLDVVRQHQALGETCARLRDAGIDTSLFIGPDPDQIESAARAGAGFVELHTGAYAEAFADGPARRRELDRIIAGARLARELGLRVNAGHGLTAANLPTLLEETPGLEELNIGHSIVSRAIFTGLQQAVGEFVAVIAAIRRA